MNDKLESLARQLGITVEELRQRAAEFDISEERLEKAASLSVTTEWSDGSITDGLPPRPKGEIVDFEALKKKLAEEPPP